MPFLFTDLVHTQGHTIRRPGITDLRPGALHPHDLKMSQPGNLPHLVFTLWGGLAEFGGPLRSGRTGIAVFLRYCLLPTDLRNSYAVLLVLIWYNPSRDGSSRAVLLHMCSFSFISGNLWWCDPRPSVNRGTSYHTRGMFG